MDWLRTQPDVLSVRVTSSSMLRSLWETRFRARPRVEGIPDSATVWVRHADKSRLCVLRGAESLCIGVPPAAQLWSDPNLSKTTKTGTRRVYLLGPNSEDRFAVYDFRMPVKTVREGSPRRRDPKIQVEDDAPWWGTSFGEPFPGKSRFPEQPTQSIPPVPAPPWMVQAASFAVTPMSDGHVLLVQRNSPPSYWACVHDADWMCHALPMTHTVDEVHPGLRATDARLPPQPPSIYRVSAANGALTVEWHWIRSTVARTPSMEFTGAWVELVKPRPGQVAERRGLLELAYGRLTQTGSDSILRAQALSVDCVQVSAVGRPSRNLVAAPGQYCVGTGGRLVLKR